MDPPGALWGEHSAVHGSAVGGGIKKNICAHPPIIRSLRAFRRWTIHGRLLVASPVTELTQRWNNTCGEHVLLNLVRGVQVVVGHVAFFIGPCPPNALTVLQVCLLNFLVDVRWIVAPIVNAAFRAEHLPRHCHDNDANQPIVGANQKWLRTHTKVL